MVFFGLGAFSYHLKVQKNLNRFHYLVLILFIPLIDTVMPFWHAILFSLSIPILFDATRNFKTDRFLGELSYPIYILHFPILTLIKEIQLNGQLKYEFLSLGSIVTLITLTLAVAINLTFEQKLNKFRHRQFKLKFEKHDIKTSFIAKQILVVYYLIPMFIVAYILFSQQASI
jgi:peptidoglycan/LPS O-acetylase OafA/YrhL